MRQYPVPVVTLCVITVEPVKDQPVIINATYLRGSCIYSFVFYMHGMWDRVDFS